MSKKKEVDPFKDPDVQEFLEWADKPGPWSEEDDKIHTIGGLTNDKEGSFMKFQNKLNTFITPSTLNIEIRFTKEKGYGVFATSDFKKGDIIEKCYCIPVVEKFKDVPSFLKDYTFDYPPKPKKAEMQVLPLGYGCIYNHSNENNANWENAKEHMYLNFIAVKDIKEGEEICTNYGKAYLKRHNLK
tara:strand:+ start:756 stop:1313 length:558 start_codon:yes stop_codon:yes gene_type:complete